MSNQNEPNDVGDETQVKAKKETRKLQREREEEELKALLNTTGGRAYIWRLLSMCGVFKTSFTGNATTYFNEGKRQIGLEVLAEVMQVDPKAFEKMQTEHVERTKR